MNEQKHLKRAVTQAKGCLTLFFSPDIYFFPFYSLFEIFREKIIMWNRVQDVKHLRKHERLFFRLATVNGSSVICLSIKSISSWVRSTDEENMAMSSSIGDVWKQLIQSINYSLLFFKQILDLNRLIWNNFCLLKVIIQQ